MSRGIHVTAADISEHGIAITRERAREKGLDIDVHCFDMKRSHSATTPSMLSYAFGHPDMDSWRI